MTELVVKILKPFNRYIQKTLQRRGPIYTSDKHCNKKYAKGCFTL